LTWEEFMKRDLKDWCITKELVLDGRELKVAIHVPEPLSSVPSFYCLFVKFFPTPFHFFDLAFYCLFSFFLFGFLSPFVSPSFFALVLFLFFCSFGFISSIPQFAWE
jgi:hypothetical protein